MTDADDAPRIGFRLDRLELFNWGTFNKKVWVFPVKGHNSLVTGDIGSGKSTMVDAITTLLLPANRIDYNKAAGADKRERDLRSYVRGHYKSERNEATGSSRPVALRGAGQYSAIVGVFRNEGFDSWVSLAQVFWTKDGDHGQPDRFYVTAERALSVAEDLSGFGDNIAGLKKKLRKLGCQVRDHFPEYGKDFRRKLGIESEQAMDLFHQTVSMKSVGNLDEFVRSHMLEPFDASKSIGKILNHFEHLTKSYETVRRAQAQLELLNPLLTECDRYDEFSATITALNSQRDAVPYCFADRKADLLERELRDLEKRRKAGDAESADYKQALVELRRRATALEIERAGAGGNRIAEIERSIEQLEQAVSERRSRCVPFQQGLRDADLDVVESEPDFLTRRDQIAEAIEDSVKREAETQNRLMEKRVELNAVKEKGGLLGEELKSLRSRKSNIPMRSLQLRQRLCDELAIDAEQLPFAGELIQVRAEHAEWEGAAERVLHGFALSVLVPDEHYPAVSDWINDHHIGTRVVYYRVPKSDPGNPRRTGDRALHRRLEIKDGPFVAWLNVELSRRADYECVENMTEFRRSMSAVTKAGQVKSASGRHEKDDRTGIGDHSSYVLGWSNQQKIEAILAQVRALLADQERLTTKTRAIDAELSKVSERKLQLVRLGTVQNFTDIDWWSPSRRISELDEEKRTIEADSSTLSRISADLEQTNRNITATETNLRKCDETNGDLNRQKKTAADHLTATRALLSGEDYDSASEHFDAIADTAGSHEGVPWPPVSPEDCDKVRDWTELFYTKRIESYGGQRTKVGNEIVGRMKDFANGYPQEASELDSSVESISGYRQLHAQLVNDDLPRFQERFKKDLRMNAIREIAAFESKLKMHTDLIRDRVGIINESLVDIDYNPGRYITLEARPTLRTEVKEFRADLRACTDDAVSGDDSDHYSERKFLQVKAIIERFQGREGFADVDRSWTALVTDVRNWFVFSASERWREDDTEFETYTDSGGKSGGQKEKLAYTILAASLAYQFKLDRTGERSKTFRFVVIDEAFGRGSDESTRFALELFEKLGSQLLIVTPLQKIHVIEPYVAAVGYVSNPNHRDSRLQTLTIEEYRARRDGGAGLGEPA